MKIDSIIILVSVLMLIILFILNFRFSVSAKKNRLKSCEDKLRYRIQAYLDTLPLTFLILKKTDKNLSDLREKWFANWNDTTCFWPVWTSMEQELTALEKALVDKLQKKRSSERMSEVKSAIHDFNESAIKLNQRLARGRQKAMYRVLFGRAFTDIALLESAKLPT